MIKRLATFSDLSEPEYSAALKEINQIASSTELTRYTTYSRVWEYPWVWFQLKDFKHRNLKILDIGSELSPFPWFLVSQGFDVTISDITANYWPAWKRVGQQLNLKVTKRTFDARNLNLPAASIDIYLSVSVIEHVPDKPKVIAEAARVLRPGGLLVLTFDICEPNMGMKFPDWNGHALTMDEFDSLLKNSAWVEPGISELGWNTQDIPEYLAWHRTTAPHHNYVTGAAVLRRNDSEWKEADLQGYLRAFKGITRTLYSVGRLFAQRSAGKVRARIARPLKAVLRRTPGVALTSLETLPDSPDLFRVYRDLEKHPELQRKPGGWLYNDNFYPDYLTVGGAGQAIFREALHLCKGDGVDIGAGFWPLPGATSVDASRGPGLGKTISDFADNSLDYIFSSHCLEHIEDWRQALDQWVKKLKIGGVAFLYLPHPDCEIWHPGSPFVGHDHKWMPEPTIIKLALSERGCKIFKFDDGPDAMQSFFVCGKKHL